VFRFVDIIDNIVSTRGYRSLKVLKIYAEIPKDVVTAALHSSPSRIGPCGGGVPPLTDGAISSATRIVAQMGIQPFLSAMHDYPDYDIIIAGRAYDPAPYAAFCVYHNILDLGVAYHMGKIMECGAQCATPKTREALATIRKDSFDVMPLDPSAKCTTLSVAAHTLYEKSRPDFHYGPDGMLDLTKTTYTQLPDGRSVRVQGSQFHSSTRGSRWTIKLEGARTNGYHSVFMGGCADPILISQIDEILPRVKAYVASKCPFEYDLKLTTYGRDGALDIIGSSTSTKAYDLSKPKHQPSTIGILSQARASTQREANMVVAMARIACVHGSYQGQKATSGNFGMPTAPQEIEMGQISEFNIYHLMTIDDPTEYFPIELHTAQGSGKSQGPVKDVRPGAAPLKKKLVDDGRSKIDPTKPSSAAATPFLFEPNKLGALASVIRSKNSGPFEITIDAIFDNPATYNFVKSSGVLNKSNIAKLYNLDESKIEVAMWWDAALAFKITIVRPMVSGGWGEIDMHASCQHVPLMHLEVPGGITQKLIRRVSLLSNRARYIATSATTRPAGRIFAVALILSSFGLLCKTELLKSVQKWQS
jgi:hypothetical protein